MSLIKTTYFLNALCANQLVVNQVKAKISRVCLCAAVVVLQGCSSSSLKPIEYYQFEAADKLMPIVLDLNVAAKLSRPGLAVAAANGNLRYASSHRWASPLTIEIRRALGLADIKEQAEKGEPVYPRIELDVSQLQGSVQGKAVLEGRWRLSCSDQGAESWQPYSLSAMQNMAGYSELVRTEQSLLVELKQRLVLASEQCPPN